MGCSGVCSSLTWAQYSSHSASGRRLCGPVPGDQRRGLEACAPLTADGVYKILRAYGIQAHFDVDGFGPHSLRATAATNALDHEADIAKVEEWLGHANIATTRINDRRRTRPEDSPTFKVSY